MKQKGIIDIKNYWLNLNRIIGRDTAFLKRMGVIDYSLLVAGETYYKRCFDEENLGSRNELLSVDMAAIMESKSTKVGHTPGQGSKSGFLVSKTNFMEP